MKTIIILLLSTWQISVSQAQTIRRVNNNLGVTGTNVYASVQAAHDAAAANDILIIDPSNTTYGNSTLTKPLKIYGNGYYLDVNTELKADKRTSLLGDVNFDTGSDGSEVYGLVAGNFIIYGVSDITISRCNFSYLYFYNNDKADFTDSNIANILCSQNYFNYTYVTTNVGYSVSSVLILNNLIYSVSANHLTRIQNWVVSNNTFRGSGTNLSNGVFENNLLTAGGTPTFSNVTASYNVSNTNSFSGGIGNQNSFNITPNLVGTSTGISLDEQYQLIPSSVLLTAGNSGIEVGAFGGATPYIISGIPALPSITEMVNTGTGSDSNPLEVTISIKSNN